MYNSNTNSGKNNVFRKVLSAVLSLVMVISTVPAFSITANAATHKDGYTFKVTIDVTNDADGWNSAKLRLYAKNLNNGYGSSKKVSEYDIKNEIDSGDSFCTKEYNCGINFPEKAEIYTDFGGGMTWRQWEADVKLYVNNTLVKSEHVVSSSSAFSSSDETDVVTIDHSMYPYPVEFEAAYENTDPEDYNFYQDSNSHGNCYASYLTSAYDQYGTKWTDYANITNDTYPDSDTVYMTNADVQGYQYEYVVNSNLAMDHRSKFTLTYQSNNSSVPTVSKNFDIFFHFRYKLELNEVVGSESTAFAEYNELKGTNLTLPEPDAPTGYHFDSYYMSGVGTLDEANNLFVFGEGEASIDYNYVANTYKIHFDGNGSDTGKMTDLSCTYDKTKKLTANKFKKTNKAFAGWNTEANGSGESYDNTAQVKNLTTTDKDTVTLYAQWADIPHDIHYEYSQEFEDAIAQYNATVPDEQKIILDEDIVVNQGDDGAVEHSFNIDSAEGHYVFTSSSVPLENITDDQTIVLTYEFVEHDYDDPVITLRETCTADGEEYQVCKDCGYKKTNVRPAVHQGLVTIPKVAPTCTETGTTEGLRCDACDTVITAPEEIPAEGHDYSDAIWEWADDFSTATATITCKKCGDKKSATARLAAREIEYTDDGTDRIYSTTLRLAGKDYTGTATYKNLYTEVPYVDENGEEQTMLAARLEQGKAPVGSVIFVDNEITLYDTFAMPDDLTLILCDTGKLNINITDAGKECIKLYDETNLDAHYYKDLTIYGQTNQTGELNAVLDNSSSKSDAISCGSYKQYGGKVNVSAKCDVYTFYGSTCAVRCGGYARHNPHLIVKNGVLNAYSENGFALYSIYGYVNILGGQVTATTGNSDYKGVGSYQSNITLGCRNGDDYITSSGYEPKSGNGTVSVQDGQLLDDGENCYSGTLTSAQVSAIANKKLVLHNAHFYADSWAWNGFDSATATLTCTACGDVQEISDNEIDSAVTKEPTCTVEGVNTYTASVVYDNQTFTNSVTGQIETVPHTYEQISATTTTCTEQGYATYTCSVCGDTYIEYDTPAKGHTIEHVPAKAPTNLDDGNIEYWRCSVCGLCFSDENAETEITQQSTVIESLYPAIINGRVFKLGDSIKLKEMNILRLNNEYGSHYWATSMPVHTSWRASDNAGRCNIGGINYTIFTADISKGFTGLFTCENFERRQNYNSKTGILNPIYVDTDYEPVWTWNGTDTATVTFSHFVNGNKKIEYEQTEDEVTITHTEDYANSQRIYIATFNKYGTTFTGTKAVPVDNYQLLTLDAGEGTGTMEPVPFIPDEEFTIPANGFSHVGYYNFTGWKIGDTVYQPGDRITLTESATATALWSRKEWRIKVGGVSVNGDNYADILGDGTVSYNPDTTTLTLNNATLEAKKTDNTNEAAIRNNETDMATALNIELVGENKIVNDITESGTSAVYGILIFDNAAGYKFMGSGSLDISFNADSEGITYTGIETRKHTIIDGTSVSINIPGTAKTYGYNMVYSNILTIKNSAQLRISTGSNDQTYSMYNNRDAQNLIVEDGSFLEVASDNYAFNSQNKITSATKLLGVDVNIENSASGALEWNEQTALSTYKYIRIPCEERIYATVTEIEAPEGAEFAYKFETACSAENADSSKYANYHADFVATFDKDVKAGEVVLYGTYGDYGWIPVTIDRDVEAGEEFRIYKEFMNDTLSYATVCKNVSPFSCGAGGEILKDTNMTVTFKLYPVVDGIEGDPIDASASVTDTIERMHYVTGDTFTMGVYPQTKVTDSDTLAALESIDCVMNSYGYMYHSSSASHKYSVVDMNYADIAYNGEVYRKVTINQYRPYYTQNPISINYSYQDENGYTLGTYYFKWEPVTWKVLSEEEDGVYVFSNMILDSQGYHNYVEDTTWADSALRTWLNGNFYNAAFSDTEKANINLATYVNEDSPVADGVIGGQSTTDKITILSYSDCLNTEYGFPDYNTSCNERTFKGTDYSKCQGIKIYRVADQRVRSWLRTPGTTQRNALNLTGLGAIGADYEYEGNFVAIGVMPAFKLSYDADIRGGSESALCRVAHEWDEGEVITAPTCTQNGSKQCTCTVCGTSGTVAVPATGHIYGEPNWTWDGYDSAKATFSCTNCTDKQELDATVERQADGKTYIAKVTFKGTEYTDTVVKQNASDTYSITVAEGVEINFYVDVPFYGAEGGHIEYTYIADSDEMSTALDTKSVDIDDLPQK